MKHDQLQIYCISAYLIVDRIYWMYLKYVRRK